MKERLELTPEMVTYLVRNDGPSNPYSAIVDMWKCLIPRFNETDNFLATDYEVPLKPLMEVFEGVKQRLPDPDVYAMLFADKGPSTFDE